MSLRYWAVATAAPHLLSGFSRPPLHSPIFFRREIESSCNNIFLAFDFWFQWNIFINRFRRLMWFMHKTEAYSFIYQLVTLFTAGNVEVLKICWKVIDDLLTAQCSNKYAHVKVHWLWRNCLTNCCIFSSEISFLTRWQINQTMHEIWKVATSQATILIHDFLKFRDWQQVEELPQIEIGELCITW